MSDVYEGPVVPNLSFGASDLGSPSFLPPELELHLSPFTGLRSGRHVPHLHGRGPRTPGPWQVEVERRARLQDNKRLCDEVTEATRICGVAAVFWGAVGAVGE